MKRTLIHVMAGCIVFAASQTQGITLTPFGPHGEGGARNGQPFKVGPEGSIHELDGFVQVASLDLNGSVPGGAAQLSRHSLPAGLAYAFSYQISADQSDVVLAYTFSNSSAAPFPMVRFFVLLDAEIDEEANTFFNEYAEMTGVPGQGSGDASPDMWQIEEPGFQAGAMLRNLYLGALSNSNAVPQAAPNDVAMALGFELGTLWPGSAATVRIMISEAGHFRGTMFLAHHDLDPASKTTITLSGDVETLASVGGFAFKDLNSNHAFESGEGISAVTLFLDLNSDGSRQAAEPQASTDAVGYYVIGNLRAGDYRLRIDSATLPPGLTNTLDPDGVNDNMTSVTLAAGQSRRLDWGFRDVVPPAQFTNITAQAQYTFLDWRLNRPRGSLIGTLRLRNPAENGAAFGPPFQLGLQSSTNLFYVQAAGTNGLPYIDLSEAVSNQAGLRLNPGQTVVISNVVEVYSRDRSAPPDRLFELWATLIRLSGTQK